MRKVFQKFVQIIFKICSQWPALVQVYLVAPLIPGLDWEVATTSVTYQSVSSSRTDESVVSTTHRLWSHDRRRDRNAIIIIIIHG